MANHCVLYQVQSPQQGTSFTLLPTCFLLYLSWGAPPCLSVLYGLSVFAKMFLCVSYCEIVWPLLDRPRRVSRTKAHLNINIQACF